MKLVMDERIKHRLVGLAVILSIGAIFAPVIMKKSSQRMEHMTVSIKLPPKPELPKVAMPDEEKMFKAVKVAHVNIQKVQEELPSVIAKAEPLTPMNTTTARQIANPEPLKIIPAEQPVLALQKTKPAIKVAQKPEKPVAIKLPVKPAAKPVAQNGYAVQLATFSQRNNANALVNKLKSKGFKVAVNTVTTKTGTVYKVVVGQEIQREKAKALQQKLASVMQIQGFVVPTRIS
ncbi:SPOR domain-containing protein [Legionella dresdenensis]|uniref:SPOR domain-containing protein n=1 Tax=Legionella dresdenensis TaxID=450200 RepID=A0ABV8CBA1_9GAMM